MQGTHQRGLPHCCRPDKPCPQHAARCMNPWLHQPPHATATATTSLTVRPVCVPSRHPSTRTHRPPPPPAADVEASPAGAPWLASVRVWWSEMLISTSCSEGGKVEREGWRQGRGRAAAAAVAVAACRLPPLLHDQKSDRQPRHSRADAEAAPRAQADQTASAMCPRLHQSSWIAF